MQFTSDQVIPAVRSHEKLSEILIELQARENKALDIKPPLNRVVENEPANEWRKNKIHLLERLNFYYLLRAKVRAILFFTLMLTHSRSISGL